MVGKVVLYANEYERDGYTFSGWNTKEDGTGTDYADKATISNLTAENGGVVKLYAKWTGESYEVTLNVNEGTINAGNIESYTYGVGATLPTDVTRDGYDFGGWYEDEECTGDAVTEISNTATGAKTFYAKWTAATYTVTLNVNEGTINAGNVTSYTYGVGATLPTDVTREGYDFGGWYEDSECAGDAVTEISTTATGAKTFYAKWTAATYTVTLNVKEGTINAGNVTSYTYGVGATLPTDVTRDGYDFGGWYEDEECTGDAVTEISTTATGAKTFYAKWTAATYTVTLNVNEGTINAGNVTSYTYGVGATLPTDVTREGYDFGGWYEDSECAGDAVTEISTTATGNKTFYAKWQTKLVGTWNYSMDYNTNGTDDLIINVIVSADGTYSFTMTRQDYIGSSVYAESGTYEFIDSEYVKMSYDDTTIAQYMAGAPEQSYLYCKDKTDSTVKAASMVSAELAIADIADENWEDFTISGSTWTCEESNVSAGITSYYYNIIEFNDGSFENSTPNRYLEGDTLLYENNVIMTADCAEFGEGDSGVWSYVLTNFEIVEMYDTCKYSLSEDCNTFTIYKMDSDATVLTRVEE